MEEVVDGEVLVERSYLDDYDWNVSALIPSSIHVLTLSTCEHSAESFKLGCAAPRRMDQLPIPFTWNTRLLLVLLQ